VEYALINIEEQPKHLLFGKILKHTKRLVKHIIYVLTNSNICKCIIFFLFNYTIFYYTFLKIMLLIN